MTDQLLKRRVASNLDINELVKRIDDPDPDQKLYCYTNIPKKDQNEPLYGRIQLIYNPDKEFDFCLFYLPFKDSRDYDSFMNLIEKYAAYPIIFYIERNPQSSEIEDHMIIKTLIESSDIKLITRMIPEPKKLNENQENITTSLKQLLQEKWVLNNTRQGLLLTLNKSMGNKKTIDKIMNTPQHSKSQKIRLSVINTPTGINIEEICKQMGVFQYIKEENGEHDLRIAFVRGTYGLTHEKNGIDIFVKAVEADEFSKLKDRVFNPDYIYYKEGQPLSKSRLTGLLWEVYHHYLMMGDYIGQSNKLVSMQELEQLVSSYKQPESMNRSNY